MAWHNELGKWGEQIAVDYLKAKGWYIRDTDWRNQHRDLDIVAINEEMTTVLFVEVKTRSTDVYGSPVDAVTLEKQHNVLIAANQYMKENYLSHLDMRFDVIAIVGTPDTGYRLEHREHAFDMQSQYYYQKQRRQSARYKKRSGRW